MGRGILRHSWILAVMCLMVGCPNPAADTGSDTKITKKHSSPDPDESTAPEPTDSPSDDGTTDPEPTDSPTPTPTPEPMRVITLAGHFTRGYTDGKGGMARFMFPRDLDVDAAGDIYVADAWAHAIRKLVSETGEVTTIAGNGLEGLADGTKAEARFYLPSALAVGSGVIYVADSGNSRICKIDLTKSETDPGFVTTIAGSGEEGYKDDPIATMAMFKTPMGLALAPDRNLLYITDTNNGVIRALDLGSGAVSTIAGGLAGSRPRNTFEWEWVYQDGLASSARFFAPMGIAYDQERRALYVSDFFDNHIRQIDLAASGTPVTTLAGDGSEGGLDGTGVNARFDHPSGLSLDGEGNLWVADRGNHKLRKIKLADKVVTTVIGGDKAEDVDGVASEAQLYLPWAIHVASDAVYFGTVYKVRELTLP